MKIVTGFRGENHITSNDDQGRNQGIFGEGSYVLKVGSEFAATLASSNELQIADGEGVMQGVHFRTAPGEQNSVTIENGAQGMKRIDLVTAHYTKNQETSVENMTWKVYKGTPTSGTPSMPEYVSGDILAGATEADMPMYAVRLNGITVEAVEKLFTEEMTIAAAGEIIGDTSIGSIGDGTITGAISALNDDLVNMSGAYIWTPKLYDLNTYVRDLPAQRYFKVGTLYVMMIQGNIDFSGVSTMIQIRNLPCAWCIGGITYIPAITSTARASFKGRMVQGNGPEAYLRDNVTSSDFYNLPAGNTMITLFGTS